MERDILRRGLEQLRDLGMGQPDRVALQPNLDARLRVFGLVENDLRPRRKAGLGWHLGEFLFWLFAHAFSTANGRELTRMISPDQWLKHLRAKGAVCSTTPCPGFL
jgi:hypothetical protein